MSGTHLPVVQFGRELTAEYPSLEAREWLITNGIGGYSGGTLAGINTRGYHGLLVAALDPPVGRTLMLVGLVEHVTVAGQTTPLSTIRWHDGTVAPDGRPALGAVHFEGTAPTWQYAGTGFAIDKTIAMDRGANVTRITYTNRWSDGPVTLRLGALVNFRDYHSRSFSYGDGPSISVDGAALRIAGTPSPASDLLVALQGAEITVTRQLYREFDLAQERARGLTDAEDHTYAGDLTVTLAPGASVQVVASVGKTVGPDLDAPTAITAHERTLLSAFDAAHPDHSDAPDWVRRLVLAADQFVVDRTLNDGSAGKTLIAGYHWFADWGRDTMISLPGLTLTTGRPDIAADILRAFADVVDGGLIPNRFPDGGSPPEYNTVDASFWFIEAIEAYLAATGDEAFVKALFSKLEGMVDALEAGTRSNIHISPEDGLIHAGEEGVQLTWMDAKVGDWVVTPRRGKPIEVNALWLSNLRFLIDFAPRAGSDAGRYRALLDKAAAGFERFWNSESDMPFDVLDGPAGHEATLRPNMIFAALGRCGAFTETRRRRIVDVVAQHLLTPAGLRSLAPGSDGYRPRYGGNAIERDGAYHQGTVWGWLIGPFIEAHLDAYGDPDRAAALLAPMADQLGIACIGTINEIFEADAPHGPRGCVAQAWSVGEVLRAWSLIRSRQRQTT